MTTVGTNIKGPHYTNQICGYAKEPLTVLEVSASMNGEHLAFYQAQYGQNLGATSNDLYGEWIFNIMLDRQAFISVLNSLNGSLAKLVISPFLPRESGSTRPKSTFD